MLLSVEVVLFAAAFDRTEKVAVASVHISANTQLTYLLDSLKLRSLETLLIRF